MDDARDFRILCRFLKASRLLAVGSFEDAAARDAAIAAAAAATGLEPVVVDVPGPGEWRGESVIGLVAAASAAALGRPVHVTGFERHARFRDGGGAEALSSLVPNVYAAVERLVELPVPVVLWFTPAVVGTFQESGCQILQWASSSFVVAGAGPEPAPPGP